ncbi:uncharacterized protein LOC115221661 [Argonauta hians]
MQFWYILLRSCFLILLPIILPTSDGSTLTVSMRYNGTRSNRLQIPMEIPKNTTHIYLNHNFIKSVGMLNYSRLVYLNLSHNIISTIQTYAFEYVKKLEVLDLSYNNITGTSLTSDTFKKLESLKILILKRNPLFVIKNRIFLPTYFSEKYEIDFSHCQIKKVEHSAISNLHGCNILNLSHNNISYIPDFTFGNIKHLERLDLSHNSLTEITPKMFAGATITTLLLNGNRMSKLHCESLNMIRFLVHLNLAGNHLKALPCANFTSSSLAFLDLSNNRLEEIDVDSLSTSLKNNLKTLRVNNCQLLQYISAKKSGFSALENLYLNNNPKLHHIDAMAFSPSNKSLKLVSIIAIAVESLPKDMLNYSHVLRLSLKNLACDCKVSWMLSVHIFHEKNFVLRCAKPTIFEGRSLLTIPKDNLTCNYSRGNHVVGLTIFGVVGVLVLLLIIYLRVKVKNKKKCKSCGKKHHKAGYVSVYSNDMDEPHSHITMNNTNEGFQDPVDV